MGSIAPHLAAVDTHVFWLASRAAGIVAVLLASASVGVGLWQALRRSPGRGPDLRVMHEALSLATLSAIAVHAVSLLGDSFLHPGIADLTIPFWTSYHRWWTGLGICAGWTLVVLGLSYYVRGRIGVARWRRLHRFAAVAWIAALGHSLGEGTDSGQTWFLVAVLGAFVPALVLLSARYLGDRRPPTLRPAPDPLTRS